METKGIRRWINAFIFALALFLLFIPTVKVHATESSGTCGENLTWTLTDDGILTISGNGTMSDYEYFDPFLPPWMSSDYPVKQVIIHNGVNNIGTYAFWACDQLSSISIPNSVISIGHSAFHGCTSLSTITIPNSVTDIEKNTFAMCTSLRNIIIPNSVKSIGEYAFDRCSGLTDISIPNSIKTINQYAFSQCSNLTSISIPDSVTFIGRYAFSRCSNLSSIEISNNVAIINEFTFSGCTSLSSIVLPSSLRNIEKRAFDGCICLRNLALPNSLESIGENAFNNCVSLNNITIPNAITSIEYGTFLNCSSLLKIEASGVDTIKGSVFRGCTSLIDASFSENVYSIGENAFSGCENLQKISNWTVDSRMTTVVSRAFENASALSELYLPRNVTAIEDYAFLGCSALTKVAIPVACTTIETGAYRYCPITDVYYEGTREQWNAISIGAYNDSLTGATIHFEAFDVYPQLVASVKIDQGDISIEVGSSTTLTATIAPDSAANKNVTWSSSDTNKATVDENGMVTGIAVGTARITVKTVDQQKTASCIVSVSAKPDPIEAFVSRMYTVALGREAEEAGLNDWVGQLRNGTNDGAGLAHGFIESQEFIGKNHSNEEYLNILYHTFFDRDPDEGGYNSWLSQLNSGTSRRHVLAGFVNSQEFTNLCDKFNINRGTLPDDENTNAQVRAFVERMYVKALGRSGEEDGINSWTQRIVNGEWAAADVAKAGFFNSQEYASKNRSNEDFVEDLYQALFDRASDEAGKADWLSRLAGGASREEIMNGFGDSQEFANMLAEFGL